MISQRDYQRNITGSPMYEVKISAITSGNSLTYQLGNVTPTGGSSGVMKKWLPFDWYRVINKNGYAITFFRNQSESDASFIPAGVIATEIDRHLRNFKIEATDGAVTADKVRILMQRRPMDADKYALEQSKNRNVMFQALKNLRVLR